MDSAVDSVITSIDPIVEIIIGTISSVVFAAFFYSVIGFTLAVVAMMYIRRNKLAKRENVAWNFLTNFHYPLILTAFVFGAMSLGAIRSVHVMTSDIVADYLQPTLEGQIGLIQLTVVSLWEDADIETELSVGETVDRLTEAFSYTADEDDWFGEEIEELVTWLVEDVGREALSATVSAMIGQDLSVSAPGSAGDAQTFSIQQIKEKDYTSLGKEISLSVKASVDQYVDSFFLSQYANIFILFLSILAFTIVEMLFYHGWWKNRSASLPSPS